MKARTSLFVFIASAPLFGGYVAASLVSACFPTDCVARGTSTTFSGSASYTGQTTGHLSGTVPAAIIVQDANAACTYTAMEFVVTLGSCSLWATLASVDDDGGAPDGGSSLVADIEPGQTCSLPLANGSVTMSVGNGALTVETGAYLTLAGTIVDDNDGAPTKGYLQWSFIGD